MLIMVLTPRNISVANILQAMAYQYQMKFTPEEIKKFEGMNSFALPM